MRFIWIFIISILTSFGVEGQEIPSFSKIKSEILSSESLLYDRNGKILQETRINKKERRLDWVHLDEISTYFLDAVILAEDRRYYDHSGVDYLALGSGFFRLFSSLPLRGGSTITMQLVGILKEELKAKKRRSPYQKWLQILEAHDLEKTWEKKEILEAYVNLVSYRGELVGISAASRGLLGKAPHGLNQLEGLFLASLIKHPSSSLVRAKERACYLLNQTGGESCEEMSSLIETSLSSPYYIQPSFNLAPHFTRKFFPNEKNRFHSTLDRDIQIHSRDALNRQIQSLRSQNVRDGAVLVRYNPTGDILAYVGGSDGSTSPYLDGVQARRQAGSTLKPFLYALGFEKKRITPLSLLVDSPYEVQIKGVGIYSPSNYNGNYRGLVTARNALGSSLNIPAVRLLDQIGISEFHFFLDSIGFTLEEDPDFYGLSLALGSPELNLWEMVRAYSALANGGLLVDYKSRLDTIPPPSQRILSEESSFLVSHILADRDARIQSFGLDSVLSTRYSASVKTGTSKDMRDNWCIGYTRDYTVGVWVGNYSGEPMWNVSGVMGAAPVWQEIMDLLIQKSPPSPTGIPPGIVSKEVRYKDGSPHGMEYFLTGTEVDKYPELATYSQNRIVYPLEGEIIAIDPDIPDSRQKLFIESKKLGDYQEWILNGRTMESGKGKFPWSPIKGYHTLELRENGVLIDKIHFEVR